MPRTNLLDKKNKLIISVNYKCASSQIIRWFRSNLKHYKHENTTMTNTINRAYVFSDKHIVKYPDFYKVLIVRNPFSRLVSSFLDKGFHNFIPLKNLCKKYDKTISDLTFKDFIEMVGQCDQKSMNAHWRPLTYDNNPEIYNKIIKMEHIHQHLNKLAKKYKYSKFPLVQKNLNKEKSDLSEIPIKDLHNYPKKVIKNYSNFYTSELISLVEKIYASDLKKFKYSYEKFLLTN